MFSKKDKILKNNIADVSHSIKKSIPSIIISDLNIKGDLVSQGAVEIGGKVVGNIKCNHVTIRKGANISGDIRAQTLIINGYVDGKIYAKDLIITSSGVVRGVVEYDYMSMDSGADIECKCIRNKFVDNVENISDQDQEFIPRIGTIMANNSSEDIDKGNNAIEGEAKEINLINADNSDKPKKKKSIASKKNRKKSIKS